jgi:hypothetical protein
VSSLLDKPNRPLVDVSVKRALFHSRNIIAATKRELETHERWLHRHKLLWQKDLERCQRVIERARVIPVRKRLVLSSIHVASVSFRTLLREAAWLLKRFGLLSLIRHDRESGLNTRRQLQERIESLDQFHRRRRVRGLFGATDQSRQNCSVRRYLSMDWTTSAMLGPVLGIAAITLLTVGAVRAAKPAPSEVILAVLPEIQNSALLAAVSPGEVPLGRAVMRDPLASAPPGFALITSVSIPEPLSLSEKGIIASTMLLMTPFLPPRAPPGFSILRATEVPEALPLSHKEITGMILLTTPLATPADVEATKPAPAALRPAAGEPEAKPNPKLATERRQAELPWLGPKPQPRESEARPKPKLAAESQQAELPELSPKPQPRLATRKRQRWDFVPHSSW